METVNLILTLLLIICFGINLQAQSKEVKPKLTFVELALWIE